MAAEVGRSSSRRAPAPRSATRRAARASAAASDSQKRCRCRARRRRRTCWSRRAGRRPSAGPPARQSSMRDDARREPGPGQPLGRRGAPGPRRCRSATPTARPTCAPPRPPGGVPAAPVGRRRAREQAREQAVDPQRVVRRRAARSAAAPAARRAPRRAPRGTRRGSDARGRRGAAARRASSPSVAPRARIAERARRGAVGADGCDRCDGRRRPGVSATAHTLNSGWNEIGSTASLVTALTVRYSPNRSFQWNGAKQLPGQHPVGDRGGQHGAAAPGRDLDDVAVGDPERARRRRGGSRRTGRGRAC